MSGGVSDRSDSGFVRIGEVFYRTRVLRGPGWTLRKFAALLGIDHVMLSYVEKGRRFPNEDTVRRLAELRQEDPRELLAILYRDRMLRALDRELRRVIFGPASEADEEQETPRSWSAVLSRALAALPDDGSPVAEKLWARSLREALRAEVGRASRADQERARALLVEKKLLEVGAGAVRKIGQHVHAEQPDERLDLALEFASIFGKSMTDQLIRAGTPTYLQNHFLTVSPDRLDELQTELDRAIREVVERFVSEPEDGGEEFFQVLVAGTTKK